MRDISNVLRGYSAHRTEMKQTEQFQFTRADVLRHGCGTAGLDKYAYTYE